MTTQSNGMPESQGQARVAPATISGTRRLYWSIRQELWENRSICIAPLAVAALFVVGFLISLIRLPARMRAVAAAGPGSPHEITIGPLAFRAVVQPYELSALLIMAVITIIAVIYSLDALYGERRDRSILFWKSMPVSDLTTVLSKAAIPILVLPLVALIVTIATHWIMLLLSSLVLLANGLSVSSLWSQLSLPRLWSALFYHLIGYHGLWFAPFYGWLLLVSAWARRVPFLWATLPLVAVGAVEKIAFNTTHFGGMLANRLGGGPEAVFPPGNEAMHSMSHLSPTHFVLNPGLWIGLVITAAFLATTVRLRRNRGPV